MGIIFPENPIGVKDFVRYRKTISQLDVAGYFQIKQVDFQFNAMWYNPKSTLLHEIFATFAI